MRRLTFSDGHQITTMLSNEEVIKRMDRLSCLIVLTEQFEDGVGVNICKKALRAYNKEDNFTGTIRLTFTEKDWLGYLLDNEHLNNRDREVIKYFTRY